MDDYDAAVTGIDVSLEQATTRQIVSSTMLILLYLYLSSKIRAGMKWWTKCISMAIAKTASRNVAFEVARMRDAIMQDQDEFITRDTNLEDVALVANDRANLEDIGCNADLYIANQEDLTQSEMFG